MTSRMTEAAIELYIAKRHAELGGWQEMYEHLFAAMECVPEDARVAWEYEHTTHEPMADGTTLNKGFGTAPDPIDQIQSVLYEHNDLGTDYITLKPAESGDDE